MPSINNFECLNCGNTTLDYEKWINCRSEVIFHPDGHIEYAESTIDENNELGACFGYICSRCGEPLFHYGNRIETEAELLDYLKLSQEERKKDAELHDRILDEEAEEEAEKEKLQEEEYLETVETMEENLK